MSLCTTFLTVLLFPLTAFSEPVVLRLNAPSGAITVDVHHPAKPGLSAVILLHGFMSSRTHHVVTAEALAREGFVVVVPDLSYGIWNPNTAERVADVRFLLSRLRDGQISDSGRPRIALVGHSAGGLTALLVAADEKVSAVVLLDVVVSSGRPGNHQPGISGAELSRIAVPVLSLEAPPHACNNDRDQGFEFLPSLGSRIKERITILGASHCDFMDPHLGCRWLCGWGSEDSRLAMRAYMIEFLKQWAR